MAEHKSPRYEKKETTTFPDRCFGDHGVEIRDNVTGKTGHGFAESKTKAEDKAFKDLEVKNLQHQWERSAEGDPIVALGAMLIAGLIVVGIVFAGLEYLAKKADQKTEALISRVYPAYETSSEKALRWRQEVGPKQERWEQFVSSSDKWLKPPGAPLSLPGKIIFISSENREIYLVDPNSAKKPVNLTRRFTGNIVAAAPSFDGEQIAFIANQKSESGIYVMNSDGTKIIKVGKTNDGYANTELIWSSPSVILVVRQLHPYIKTIWETRIDGSGKTIALSSLMMIPSYEEYNGKWVEEGNRRGGAKFYSCAGPAVSPDRERLAYVKDEYASFDPGIIPAQKVGSQIIVKEGVKEYASRDFGAAALTLGPQAWSPSGNKIVFHFSDTKDRIGILELGEPRPGKSPFSKKLYWLDIAGKNPAWSPHRDRSAIDSGVIAKSSTAWSPDGRRVGLTVSGKKPAWSPDGKWIVFDNEGTIYAIEVTSGHVRKIVGPKFSGRSGESPLWVQ